MYICNLKDVSYNSLREVIVYTSLWHGFINDSDRESLCNRFNIVGR